MVRPTDVPDHIGWSRAFSSNCDKHVDFAGNGRCPECLAQKIKNLQSENAALKDQLSASEHAISELRKRIEALKGELAFAEQSQKELRKRLTILRTYLEKIRDHEHCDGKMQECFSYSLIDYNGTLNKARRAGCAQGHRCCSTIAADALKEEEECK